MYNILWIIIAVLILMLLLKRVSHEFNIHPIRSLKQKFRAVKVAKNSTNIKERPSTLDFVNPDSKPDRPWR